ncbi:MAG TPA: PDZ domain-containing protein [Acidobacteriota bacterium]|nr:PDZ domain-containing protein [Acidobacteriota bacterium]
MRAMRWIQVLLIVLCLGWVLAASGPDQVQAPYLLQEPTLSSTHIVFAFGDDLWIVDRSGGDARRLTTGEGAESNPYFSPDGQWVAFTGNYDGNTDAFIVPAQGGIPERLTFHPGSDLVRGWTPDGASVLFSSNRNSIHPRQRRLFTISVEGGMPEQVPLPIASYGAYSPDGQHMAYDPRGGAYQTWKRYRGGLASTIWVADLSDSSVTEISGQEWNDFHPMWLGDAIYFLSDRDGYVTLYSHDPSSGQTERCFEHTGFDLKWASAGPDAIVFEQFGSLGIYDPDDGSVSEVAVTVRGDLPSVRPRFEEVRSAITAADISPTGKRAVLSARGEIITVPAEKGDARNLTRSSGAADRDPSWSPDGRWIAYFSDQSGEYQLHLEDQTGREELRKISLSDNPTFYYAPVWSPDSKYLAYSDKSLNLWILDVEAGTPSKVDDTAYRSPVPSMDPSWSPDSRWLIYTKQLANHVHVITAYDRQEGTTHQLTDGLSDARYAAFDQGGRHIFFTASTDIGPTLGWGEMSSLSRPVTRSVYVMVLRADDPSPLAPESDEEEVAPQPSDEEEQDESAEEPSEEMESTEEEGAQEEASDEEGGPKKDDDGVRIDLEGLDQRILALPIPNQNISDLQAGAKGQFFYTVGPDVPPGPFGGGPQTLHRFDLKSRESQQFMEGVSGFVVSHDRKKMLAVQGSNWSIVDTARPPKPGQGRLNLNGIEVRVDPRQEWRQIYREVWRIERDFLYDPGAHGLDLEKAEQTYSIFLDNLASRSDLNYLISEMLGNLVLGHTRNGGGDMPQPDRVSVGMLGADFEDDGQGLRISRIYQGENWNPQLRAPLTAPGVDVAQGEYLLEVDGQPVQSGDNVFSFFQNRSGEQVVLTVGPNADGSDSRQVTVQPTGNDLTLRHRAWIDSNRRKVAEMTGGRAGYVYLPNTAGGGFTNFNRYYYAQTGKDAMVIDERFNGGGLFANWIVEQMKRPLINLWEIRDSATLVTPAGQVFGPKVMIINEFAGSGGDWMPWYFRKAGVGQLVGKRTWGGLVGIFGFPALIDGGGVTAPNLAFWTPEGEWLIENVGVPPDIDVEYDPAAWRQGRDPQLERAVQVILEELEANPPEQYEHPEFPNYYENHRQPGNNNRP